MRRFIDKADVQTKNEISLELTYDELDKSIENLWSVLFTTGYLTHNGHTESGKYRLVIPNREVRKPFYKENQGIVIELKYAENGDVDAACAKALEQIEEKDYVDRLRQDGMRNFIKYGIACFTKDCKVVVGE